MAVVAIFDVNSVSRLIDATIIIINKNRETPSIVDNRLAIHSANPLLPNAEAIAIPPPNNNNIPQGNLTVSSQFSKGLFFLSVKKIQISNNQKLIYFWHIRILAKPKVF